MWTFKSLIIFSSVDCFNPCSGLSIQKNWVTLYFNWVIAITTPESPSPAAGEWWVLLLSWSNRTKVGYWVFSYVGEVKRIVRVLRILSSELSPRWYIFWSNLCVVKRVLFEPFRDNKDKKELYREWSTRNPTAILIKNICLKILSQSANIQYNEVVRLWDLSATLSQFYPK